MSEIRVTYYHEDGTWWAESADVPGFTAVADALPELRQLVREGLMFHLDLDSIDLRESMDSGGIVATIEIEEPPFGGLINSPQVVSAVTYKVSAEPVPWLDSPLMQLVAS